MPQGTRTSKMEQASIREVFSKIFNVISIKLGSMLVIVALET